MFKKTSNLILCILITYNFIFSSLQKEASSFCKDVSVISLLETNTPPLNLSTDQKDLGNYIKLLKERENNKEKKDNKSLDITTAKDKFNIIYENLKDIISSGLSSAASGFIFSLISLIFKSLLPLKEDSGFPKSPSLFESLLINIPSHFTLGCTLKALQKVYITPSLLGVPILMYYYFFKDSKNICNCISTN